MSLTSNSNIDEITIKENGIILLRTNTIIMDGETQIAQNYSRTSLFPGQDLTNQPANIVAIANLTWTPNVISAYQTSLTNSIAGA